MTDHTANTPAHDGDDDVHEEHTHPSEGQYIKIAVILAVVTAAEVLVYYIPSLRPLLVPVLLAMAVVKFIMVALYFMHLKYDSRMFRRFFVLGVILSLAVFSVVLLTFSVLGSAGTG
ncbi:MAG TPA: cytochrome C oxidase subunit IV family protein [Actinomycetota bacterium]|nr:cytochrome C oxidase subunit IV family protein [Actinomycetota bacterium]